MKREKRRKDKRKKKKGRKEWRCAKMETRKWRVIMRGIQWVRARTWQGRERYEGEV